MNRARAAYLILERLAMEADDDGDGYADFLRDHLPAFWDAMANEDQAALRARRGKELDELNGTRVVEAAGWVSAVVPVTTSAPTNSDLSVRSVDLGPWRMFGGAGAHANAPPTDVGGAPRVH